MRSAKLESITSPVHQNATNVSPVITKNCRGKLAAPSVSMGVLRPNERREHAICVLRDVSKTM